CQARACSSPASPASVVVSTPSETIRVASLPCRAESRSEYGPHGLSSVITGATVAVPSARPRLGSPCPQPSPPLRSEAGSGAATGPRGAPRGALPLGRRRLSLQV